MYLGTKTMTMTAVSKSPRTRWALLLAAALLAGCQASNDRDRAALANGYSEYSAHQFGPSEQAANDYITKYPKDPHIDEAYYLRGISRLGRGDRANGADDLRRAIGATQRSDLRAKSYRTLGDLAYDAQLYAAAASDYSQALQNAEGAVPEVRVLYRIGACLQAVGQWDHARSYLQRAADMAGSNTASADDRNLRQRIVNRLNARSFSIQFAAFREPTKADDEVKALARLGIQSAVFKEVHDNQWLFFVRAGSYPTRLQAESAARSLLAKQPGIVVVP